MPNNDMTLKLYNGIMEKNFGSVQYFKRKSLDITYVPTPVDFNVIIDKLKAIIGYIYKYTNNDEKVCDRLMLWHNDHVKKLELFIKRSISTKTK
jgi:hypothetical protein